MNEQQAKLNCQICDKPKAKLHKKNSKLMPQVSLAVCSTCIEKEWEPRWVIIIVGRQQSIRAVSKYIVKHLYPGDDIKASDLVKE